MAQAKVIPITGSDTVEVPRSIERAVNHGYYMISAALDIMESTFADQKTHEGVTGRKNTFYCTPDQIDLIMFLLYEASTDAKTVRDALTF